MSNPYTSPLNRTVDTRPPSLLRDAFTVMVKLLIGYFLLSIFTLPFLSTLWIGELPVLAILQWPKVESANWCSESIVMPLIKLLGLSSGSYSPDCIAARPYALLIVYFVLLSAVFLIQRCCFTSWRSLRHIDFALMAVASIDFAFTLVFGATRQLTIY